MLPAFLSITEVAAKKRAAGCKKGQADDEFEAFAARGYQQSMRKTSSGSEKYMFSVQGMQSRKEVGDNPLFQALR